MNGQIAGYDEWKLASPGEDRAGACVECGDPIHRDDDPLNVDDGWACTSECEAMHNLHQAVGPADVLAAADVAYGEGCEFVLRLSGWRGGETLCSHLARNGRLATGYMAEDLDGHEWFVLSCYVERAEVVG